MKKSIFIFGTVVFLAATIQSCKKDECHDCHYDKAGIEVEMGEYCGEALENLEAQGTYTDSTGTYEVHCHGH
ncbi:MAG: hypothetical protein ACKO7D_05950 [Bacteroidota bacterium]